MVVDFARPSLAELEAMGLARPHFDKLADHDPALEKYDYIILNDSVPLKTKDEIAIKTARYSYPMPLINREGNRPPLVPAFERWDQNRDDGHGSTNGRTIAKPSIDSQKKALFGTSQMTEHQLLLMPHRVPAFSLKTKRWRML